MCAVLYYNVGMRLLFFSIFFFVRSTRYKTVTPSFSGLVLLSRNCSSSINNIYWRTVFHIYYIIFRATNRALSLVTITCPWIIQRRYNTRSFLLVPRTHFCDTGFDCSSHSPSPYLAVSSLKKGHLNNCKRLVWRYTGKRTSPTSPLRETLPL